MPTGVKPAVSNATAEARSAKTGNQEIRTQLPNGRRMLAEILRVGQKRGQVRSDRSAHAMSLAFQ
jgi:hypothetical protein